MAGKNGNGTPESTPREPDLLRFVTMGSVDDGKSTLIGRLLHDTESVFVDQLKAVKSASEKLKRDGVDLSLLTDGLRAEREQGITIDVAYRHFATPRRRFIIADTPGHVQYTRNMATGASTADLALLLVDARNGLLTQTRRHAFIASLLGLKHLVLVVNKMDAVGFDQAVFQRIADEFQQFAARLRFTDLRCIPISALAGDNVVTRSAHMPWYSGPAVLEHLETVYVGGDRNLVDLRFSVQTVVRPHQDFRGYAGQVVSGVIRQGDEVVALPSERRSRVKEIVTFDGPRAYAFPPQSVTVVLEDELDISRGDVLVRPHNRPPLRRDLEAMMVWLSAEPLRVGEPYLVKHLAAQVKGVVKAVAYRVDPDTLHREDATTLNLNDIGRISLTVYRPLPSDGYETNRATGSFILIDPVSNATVGAGMIVDRAQAGTIQVEPPSNDQPMTAEQRASRFGQKPCTLWLTGLSGAGKSTLARGLEKRLFSQGRACFVLDGDEVRGGLNKGLGFSAEDRCENIRRCAEVARLMNEAGLLVVTAFISPYRADRKMAREIVGDGRFVELFVDAPLEVCEKRDVKGLYRKARAGEIKAFTGVSDPYEAPESPELRLATGTIDLEASLDLVLEALEQRGVLPRYR
ncbi:MAG TPA: sulfate adenylyltransferase subunit CysN [Myxococcales bacterium]|jgi:bifunctional enzyme CysN/CysC